jgi:hypothetical protein
LRDSRRLRISVAVDEQDVQTLMTVLFDIQLHVRELHRELLGDDDEEEGEE